MLSVAAAKIPSAMSLYALTLSTVPLAAPFTASIASSASLTHAALTAALSPLSTRHDLMSLAAAFFATSQHRPSFAFHAWLRVGGTDSFMFSNESFTTLANRALAAHGS